MAKIIGILTSQEWNSSTKIALNMIEHLKHCDTVEFRGDSFGDTMLESFKKFKTHIRTILPKLNTLFTIRLKSDGGYWENDDIRFEYLEKAHTISNSIDIELEALQKKSLLLSQYSNTHNIVISHHQFKKGYSLTEYQAIFKSMHNYKPTAIFKIAVNCQNLAELETLIETAKWIQMQNFSHRTCLISMGTWGIISRIITPIITQGYTYAFLGNMPTVVGQCNATQLNTYLHNLILKQALQKYLSSSSSFKTLIDTIQTIIS